MARGPPGIAPGIARHCSGQVVLANWLYDMMCVCCLCLSLFLSLTVFPLWCVLERFQKKTSGDLTGSAVQIARGPPGIAPGIAAGIVHAKWSVQIARGPPGTAPGIARHCSRHVVLAGSTI